MSPKKTPPRQRGAGHKNSIPPFRGILLAVGAVVLAVLLLYSNDFQLSGVLNDVQTMLQSEGTSPAPREPSNPKSQKTPLHSPRPSTQPGGVGMEALQLQKDKLNVIVLDVGQGNSVLVQTPNGSTMLVDAGERMYSEQLLGDLAALGVDHLDALVATHPHSDHIGGMRDVLESLDVDQIYMPRAESKSATYTKLLQTIRDQNKKVIATRGGAQAFLELDPALTIRVLAPLSDSYSSLNDYSIVLHIRYGQQSILLTGDAERRSEKEMLADEPSLLSSSVLLLGHHGSSTSSSAGFLDAVQPQVGIISCGADNDYGHPHPDTIQRLEERNIPYYRTDLQGCIGVFFSQSEYEIAYERPLQP